jgi:pilus assembly protein CpaC
MPGMIELRKTRTMALFCALAGYAFLPSVVGAQTPPGVEPARPGEQVISLLGKDSKLTLVELQTRIVELSNRIRTVDGHDPEIITIDAVSKNRIRLKAEKPGVTSFSLTDEFDNVYTVEVFVDADVRALQSMLKRLFPGASIEVVGLNGDVLLRGWVIDPTEIPRIVEVAKKFAPNVLDQMNVGGVSQVQLQVKVMEVQRSKLRELGFNFLHVGQNGYFSSNIGQLAPINSTTLPFGGPPSVTVNPAALAGPTAQFAVVGSDSIFQAFIEAVETNSLAKVLAETTLVTNSGRPATMLAGGQFPILVPQSLGTVTIQYREFGVRMEALPLVLGNGRLRLDVAPEVSERDFTGAVSVGGFVVPGITIRRVNTQVEMRFGETLMLGGLILQRETETRIKVPFLGDLPWIGSAFSRRRSDVGETEVMIMVTPQMAAPITPGQLPITGPGTNTESPASREFYFDGFMEVPRYNPNTDPIGSPSEITVVNPEAVGAPVFAEPSLPPAAESAPPVDLPEPAMGRRSKSDNQIQQASGIRESSTRKRSTTLGVMDSDRFSIKKEIPGAARSAATVKPNTGDNVRAGGTGTPGHSTGGKSTRFQMIEPAPDAQSAGRSDGYSNR